ncbi:Protein REVEILLE 8 [Glycine soja]
MVFDRDWKKIEDFVVLVPLLASVGYTSSRNTLAPGFASWDETSVLVNAGVDKPRTCQDELNNGITKITNNSLRGVGNYTKTLPTSEIAKQGKQAPVLHGIF